MTENTYKANERFGEAEKGDFQSKIISQFNKKGNSINRSEYIGDGSLLWAVSYIYDKFDKKVEEVWHNEIHNYSERIVYKNDGQNNIIEKNRYSLQNILERKYKYKHDQNGFLIEENWYDSAGTFTKKIIYKHNKAGNVVEESYYGSDEFLYEHRENKYNQDGYIIESVDILNLEVVGKAERSVIHNVSRFEYTFDNVGNWTKQIEFSSDKTYKIVERQIEYY